MGGVFRGRGILRGKNYKFPRKMDFHLLNRSLRMETEIQKCKKRAQDGLIFDGSILDPKLIESNGFLRAKSRFAGINSMCQFSSG